ncbi:MAG: amidohydrolase family protein [Alphaproteobacteria bacterium]|nr:amidohydrolase family protein [Alphaproteobacteria bacterium]
MPPVSADLLIKNLRPWGATAGRTTGMISLAAVDGRFVPATADLEARQVIDAGGRLAIPGFIDPHIHLDKVMINRDVRPNLSGTLTEAIEIIWEKKKRYTVEDIVARAGSVIESAVANGVTRLRTHVDVDTIGGLRPLEGVLAAREKYRGCIDVQIVAFPQEGILRDPGTDDLMAKAMEMGADVVGGMPFNEASPADSARHIRLAFELARAFDADIDMHVDETDDPNARTLEMLADQTVENGYEGRVTAGHTCALAAYPADYAARVIDKVRRAKLHMITNPATNLMLQGRLDAEPKRRGITRVAELLAAGINVSYGQDCVRDTFYPFGRDDPLEVALITAHAAHLSQPPQIGQLFAMPTTNAARVLRLTDYGLTPGCAADLAILDAADAAEAIRLQPPRRWVIKAGRVVAETELRRQIWI